MRVPAHLMIGVSIALSGVPAGIGYRLETPPQAALAEVLEDEQIGILEKLNRADRVHLGRLRRVVFPDQWVIDERAYSPMPMQYDSASALPKALVVVLDIQAFGAYEHGRLSRWGPVSTGARGSTTRVGRLSLNWKSSGRTSTVNREWFMPWYFNVRNEEGVAFHAYALPGRPASHGCIRLLERDAIWLFHWGEEWTLDSEGRVRGPGTPVLITGRYDFDAPPPWIDVEALAAPMPLPDFPVNP